MWHFWVPAGASAGITAFQWQATNHCRKRAGVEECFGGYAEHHGMEAFVVITQFAGFGLTQAFRHQDYGKESWTFYFASNAIWLTNGILQTQHQCHESHLKCGLDDSTMLRMRRPFPPAPVAIGPEPVGH